MKRKEMSGDTAGMLILLAVLVALAVADLFAVLGN